MTVPDPAGSRAVLIGTYSGCQTLGPWAADLPAVERNLAELRRLLTDGTVWHLPPEHCLYLPQPEDERTVLREVQRAATEATDTLLVYYAGHGLLVGKENDLYLALPGAELDDECLSYKKLRTRIKNFGRRARRTVVILDCCFSGRALAWEMGPGGLPADIEQRVASVADINGACVLTASAATRKALAPEGAVFTAFTGELIDVLRQGAPGAGEFLDMTAVYRELRDRLAHRSGVPEPQFGAWKHGGGIILTRNRAHVPRPQRDDIPDPVPPPEWSKNLGLTVVGMSVLLKVITHAKHERVDAELDTAAQLPVAEVVELAKALVKAGRPKEAGAILQIAARQQPLAATVELIGAISGWENDRTLSFPPWSLGQSTWTGLVAREVGSRPTADVAAVITALREEHIKAVLEAVGTSQPIPAVVELTELLRARDRHSDAHALLEIRSRMGDAPELLAELGERARDDDIVAVLSAPGNWDRLTRRVMAQHLSGTRLDRKTWRPLLRRHAPYMPKTQRQTNILHTVSLVILMGTLGWAEENAKLGIAVSWIGSAALLAYGTHLTRRTIKRPSIFGIALASGASSGAVGVAPLPGLVEGIIYATAVVIGLVVVLRDVLRHRGAG